MLITPHYAMFGHEVSLPADWVFPSPSVEKRTMYHWTGDMIEERQQAYKSMRGVKGGRLRQKSDIVQQNLDNSDPEQWLDVGELTELLEVTKEKMEVRAREQPEEQERHELSPEPDLEIPVIPEDSCKRRNA